MVKSPVEQVVIPGLYRMTRYDFAIPVARHNAPMNPAVVNKIMDLGEQRGFWPGNSYMLDPMAGVGTGGFIAAVRGYNCELIELEPHHYHDLEIAIGEFLMQPRLLPSGVISAHNGDCREVIASHDEWRNAFDLVLTSPPYGDTLARGSEGPYSGRDTTRMGKMPKDSKTYKKNRKDIRPKANKRSYGGYGDTPGQLGALSMDDYWLAMRDVYSACLTVLKPGGFLVTITKDFVRAFERVRIMRGTVDACSDAGFSLRLWARATGAHGGTWKRALNVKYRNEGKDDLVVDHEDVLFFQKEA